MKSMTVLLALVCVSGMALATTTVATFADPSPDGQSPLFTINTTTNTISGGWDDSLTGLNLEIKLGVAQVFTDAWFVMTDVSLLGSPYSYTTGGGQIDFYADGTNTNPILTITFASGYLTPLTVFGADLVGNNVVISGTAIENTLVLSDEAFSFSLANQTPYSDGFTGTASFTSSAFAEQVPEPVSMGLLLAGALLMRRKRNG